VWAEVSPIGGRESFFGAQITGDSTHGVRLRYYQGLNSTMRFLFFDPKTKTNRALNIENVNDLSRINGAGVAVDVRAQVTGLSDVMAKLRKVGDEVKKKVLKKAMLAGGEIVRDVEKAFVPIYSDPRALLVPGLLGLSMEAKIKTFGSGITVAIIGPQKSMVRERGKKPKGYIRGKQLTKFGELAKQMKTGKGGAQAAQQDPVKYAHLAGPGRHQTFREKAIQSAQTNARDIIIEVIRLGIENAAK